MKNNTALLHQPGLSSRGPGTGPTRSAYRPKLRDREKEEQEIRDELMEIAKLCTAAATVNNRVDRSPQTRRAQTLKIKVAARRLSRLHMAILIGGKGRAPQ